jgi:hypothetical protein
MERRRAESFLESVGTWHHTCIQVSNIFGDALHDEAIIRQDIGVVIDKADGLLLTLGFYIPDALHGIRRRNPSLADRFDCISQKVYHLRNETTRFLIRSQGPAPVEDNESNREMRLVFYYQALEEVGFKARQIKRDLDQELKSIWHELQVMMIQAERTLANQV